ncbi:MAG: hypothetical protein K9M84_00080 [Spirochaetia bacterium]|nr:hypothetical protein [Spirochaetia bacterium]
MFLSPARGLVAYDSATDSFTSVEPDDARIKGLDLFPEPEIHTVFGDVYLLLAVCKTSGLLEVLRTTVSQDTDYERVLSHLLHAVLQDRSKISCDDFIGKYFASYLFRQFPTGSLGSDTLYFSMMGEDHSRLSFFRTFVSYIRKDDPGFGTGCCVNSTPLPNMFNNNPFNALKGSPELSVESPRALPEDD